MQINKRYRKMLLLARWADENEAKVFFLFGILLLITFALDIIKWIF